MLTSSFKPIHSGKQVTTWEWLLLLCKSTCFKRGSSFWMSLSWVFPTSSSLPNNRPSFKMAQRSYVFSSTKLKFMSESNFYRNWNLPSVLGERIRLWLWHVNETVSPPVGWTDVEKASELQDPPNPRHMMEESLEFSARNKLVSTRHVFFESLVMQWKNTVLQQFT